MSLILTIISIILVMLFSYQFIYVLVGLFSKKPLYGKDYDINKAYRKYAVLIACRNEEDVVGKLIESIKNQTYPADLVNIFVVADNCTDNTAQIAKKAGATVYKRFNDQLIGKGYALEFLLEHIKNDYGFENFDGYFVFDADALLDRNYIVEVDKMYDSEYSVITSYRNSKNFDSNWISATTGLWFLRESQYMNRSRVRIGSSSFVSGTGFMMKKEVIIEEDGWHYFRLTEDAEFTAVQFLKGKKIGYCEDAIFYDEQPIRFIDSWNQRLRWVKGFYQVLNGYGLKIFAGIFKRGFPCFDALVTFGAGYIFIFTILVEIARWVIYIMYYNESPLHLLGNGVFVFIISYLLFFIMGLITLITEKKRIVSAGGMGLLHLFLFPIFVLTYAPMGVITLFVKVKWVPIQHSVSCSVDDMVNSSDDADLGE